jgi:hypothetical protein
LNRRVVFVALLALTLGLLGDILLNRQVLVGAVPPYNLPPSAAPAFRLIMCILVGSTVLGLRELSNVVRHNIDRSR